MVEDTGASDTDHPFNELKSIILAIDWEITEEALDALLAQADSLLPRYEADKTSSTLLKILKSLAKYLRTQGSNAHPNAIMQIMSAYSSLEKVAADDNISESDKETILVKAVKQFKQLKAEITGPKAAKPQSDAQGQVTTGAVPNLDEVIKAIDALKSMVAAELESIRKEIAQLKRA